MWHSQHCSQSDCVNKNSCLSPIQNPSLVSLITRSNSKELTILWHFSFWKFPLFYSFYCWTFSYLEEIWGSLHYCSTAEHSVLWKVMRKLSHYILSKKSLCLAVAALIVGSFVDGTGFNLTGRATLFKKMQLYLVNTGLRKQQDFEAMADNNRRKHLP